MARAVLDVSGSTAGVLDYGKENTVIEITTTDVLGQIKLIEFETAERYALIHSETVKDFKNKKIVFPIAQKKFSEIPSMYTVEVINSREEYMRSPTDYGNDVTTRVLVQIKDDVFAGLNSEVLSKIPILRFINLAVFITAIDVTARYATIIINISDVKGKITENGSSTIDLDELKSELLKDINSKIKDQRVQQAVSIAIVRKFKESDLPLSYEHIHGRTEVPVSQRDSLRDYALNVLPLMPLQARCVEVAMELFNRQYYYPSIMLEEIKRLLPQDVVISKDTYKLFHEQLKPNVRIPRLNYGFRHFENVYL